MSTTENNTRLNRTTGEKSRSMPTETKASTKTTELIVYLAAVLAVAIASILVGDNGPKTPDQFSTAQAMQYITYLTIGYMISRGLAKAGSSNHGDE